MEKILKLLSFLLAFFSSVYLGTNAYAKGVDLLWSTFLGGSSNDTGYAIAVDSSDCAYVTGETNSSNFPTTAGAFDESPNENTDVFVTKLNSAGSDLEYSTFLGGSGDDEGCALAVDANGSAYVAGSTNSSNFPTTSGAYDESHNGDYDVFLAKLHSDGTGLAYSTFLGGDNWDSSSALALDSEGCVYVTGWVHSSNFPSTSGAFDESQNGSGDAFVTKFNSAGSDLVYSTFLGASGDDDGWALSVDANGCAYAAGSTMSSGFPTTTGAFDQTYNFLDCFITKLNSTGSSLEYSTFLGGSGPDLPFGLAVDSQGSAYVTGYTASFNFPATSGAFDESQSGNYDFFITKLNPGGTGLDYSTYLGGGADDRGQDIALDSSGCAVVTGNSNSEMFPTTPGAFNEYGRGVIVARLNSDGSDLVYSTSLGDGFGQGLAVDTSGCAYVAGYTSATDFPTTSGAFDRTWNGGDDAFVAKLLEFNHVPVADAGADQVVRVDEVVAFDGSGSYDPDGSPLTYTWDFGDGESASGVTVTHTYTATGSYTVTLTVDDGEDAGSDTCEIEVLLPGQPYADAGPDQETFVSEVVTFDGSGSFDPDGDPLTYDWEFGDGESAAGVTVTHTYTATGVYTVTLTVNDGGMSNDDVCSVSVANRSPSADAGPDQVVYTDDVVIFDGSGSSDPDGHLLTYGWDFGDGETGSGVTTTHSYTATGIYTVTLTVNDGEDSDSDTCQVQVLPAGQPFADAGPDQEVSTNEVVTFDGSGSFDPDGEPLTYSWDLGEGSSAAGITVTHTYYSPGVYTVTLTISDGLLSDDDTCTVVVVKGEADAYFVATDGDDSNPGTLEAPWATLDKAAATLQPGDIVYIREGTYFINHSVTPVNSNITFASCGNEEPVFDGGSSTPVFTLNSSHSDIYFNGLTFQNCNYSAIHINRDSPGSTPPHRIELRNCTFRNCVGSCVKIQGGSDIIFAGCVFRDSKQGIELSVSGAGNTYNIQIIDCEMSGMSWEGVVGKAQHSGPDWIYWTEDVYIAGCEVYDCVDDGIDLFGRHFTLEHCIVHDVDSSGVPPSGGTQYDEDGHGFKVYAINVAADEDKYHAEFIRCLTYNVNREGFKLTHLMPGDVGVDSRKFRMLNCTGAGNDYGILLVSEENNPFEVEMKNCLISTRNLDPGDPWPYPPEHGEDLSRALHVTGNPVIWGAGDEPVASLPGYLNFDFDYNLWYSLDENGSLLEPIELVGTLYSDVNINNGTWYADTGCGEHSISYDPLFVDEENGNFHLDENSPCIDTGVDIGFPYAGAAPDMGVYESGAVAVSSPDGYLKSGENWISIPLAPENPGPYAVFADINHWPNSVYHNLYRYGIIGGTNFAFIPYPTYMSYSFEFGKIEPGGAYKLVLAGAQLPITASGIELKEDQTIPIPGMGWRDFYFGCPFTEPVLWSSCQIDKGGTVLSIAEAISNGWIGSDIKHFNPQTQSWEPIGAWLEPWHAYRLQARTLSTLDLIIPYPVHRAISGTVTFEYPGWVEDTAAVMYQVREPGLPPTEPLYEDTLTVSMSTGSPATGSFTIPGVVDGTYDLALKHGNHVADMIPDVVVAGSDVTGLGLTLWAGDADGDDNVETVSPGDPEGDNDIELSDYYTLYYQYTGGLPLTTGCNADFNADGSIDLEDYYGLYYGYQNNSDPGNWY